MRGLGVCGAVLVCACLLVSRVALVRWSSPAAAPARWASARRLTPFAAAPAVGNRLWCAAAALVCQFGQAGSGLLVRRIWLMVMLDGKLSSSVLGGFGRDVEIIPERGGSARPAPVHVYFVKVCCVLLHAATSGAWPGIHSSSSRAMH